MSQQIWNEIFIAHAILGKDRALGSGVCIYTYAGGTPSASELSSSSDDTGGVPVRGGALRGGGAPVPLRLHRVCGFFAVPLWQGTQPSIWFSRTIAGCLSIAAFTLLCLRNSTPCFFSSRTSARGFLISCCVSSIAAREIPSLAILAIVKARRMSDCWSCIRPPCLAIVADMLKTSKKLVAASVVRSEYYLIHRQLRSLLWSLWSLYRPFPGTFLTRFISQNLRTDDIVMFNFADCVDICLGWPWRFAFTGSDKLVT